jgi:Fe-S oxidoreductase
MRAFLDEKHSGGHPIKKRVLHFLASSPDKRLPVTAKALALGQKLNNLGLGLVPQAWRRRMENPALSGPGPELGFANLSESLKLSEAFILASEDVQSGRDVPETVFYFPGCGAGLFYREIGMAASALLLAEGVSVILPDVHLCCGYPLLSQGLEDAYLNNYGANVAKLRKLLSKAERKGFRPQTVLTSCGTCRESLDRWGVATTFGRGVEHKDVAQYLLERLPAPMTGGAPMLYHAACHAEWTGQHPAKAGEVYRDALVEHLGTDIRLSPGCCGESGLGAMTSPKIYNRLRSKKQDQLKLDLPKVPAESPLLVGCPSCKVGIKRCLLGMEGTEGAAERQVLHTLEHLAEARLGPDWKREFVRHLRAAKPEDGLRLLEVA